MYIRFFFITLVFVLISCSENIPDCNVLDKKLRYSIEITDSVTVKLSWMGYTRSNYMPQYRIDSTLYSDYHTNSYYYNKEIDIICLDKELQEQINNLGNAKAHTTYILTGNLRSNDLWMNRLDVISGKIYVKDDTCKSIIK